ncbi:hypothetical protein ACWGCW_33320 [Streptomyces sp. NPDC054933]
MTELFLQPRPSGSEPLYLPLPPDQIIRACDYLQAVWEADDNAQAAADDHVYGQLPTRHLLVEFLRLVKESLALLTAANTAEGTPVLGDERSDAVSDVLARALREWAQSGHEEAAEGIARAVNNYLLVTTDSNGDLVPILDSCRKTAAAAPRRAEGD